MLRLFSRKVCNSQQSGRQQKKKTDRRTAEIHKWNKRIRSEIRRNQAYNSTALMSHMNEYSAIKYEKRILNFSFYSLQHNTTLILSGSATGWFV